MVPVVPQGAPCCPAAAPAPPQILVVDDQDQVRRLLAVALPAMGFRVLLAASGNEAIQVYRQHGKAIDLVLLDVVMPGGLDGVQTFLGLRQIDPQVRCCFMSGHTGQYPIHKLFGMGVIDIFLKPFASLEGIKQSLLNAIAG